MTARQASDLVGGQAGRVVMAGAYNHHGAMSVRHAAGLSIMIRWEKRLLREGDLHDREGRHGDLTWEKHVPHPPRSVHFFFALVFFVCF